MSNFFSNLFSSTGLKRRIAAYLTTIVNIAYAVLPGAPQVQQVIDVLNKAIQAFGGVAVTHAATQGTLPVGKLATLSSIIGAVLLLAPLVHLSLPVGLVAALIKLQTIVAGIVAGQALGKPFEA